MEIQKVIRTRETLPPRTFHKHVDAYQVSERSENEWEVLRVVCIGGILNRTIVSSWPTEQTADAEVRRLTEEQAKADNELTDGA